MEEKQALAIFDFDHTLTTGDTLLAFIRFVKGKNKFISGLLRLSPTLILYKLHLMNNQKAKEKVLTHFFGGMNAREFAKYGMAFQENILPGMLRKEAMEALSLHQKKNNQIIVITASAREWIAQWCDQHAILCIATQLEIKEEKITGKIEGKNCYGEEKLRRLLETIDLKQFEEIHVYGDSKGDKELLSIATHPHYKSF
ncbi:HAD-IB family hydrolase [Thermoflavifilum thermophilum]|uniref:HAD-superfamily subfamily IB hydrolase, TIGR01490 n=1 Tax=Thermoflavifilum thermophilum TaxID=1393122 RepID=A0A1I7NEA9_9BACT|nr:HAD-IB family hydrolase [Thermoflavifilum thermophilum]SFV33007.1 HAD-superfamily subfamily IB hydrolase, TIGR01490 [Thermoflavifilum thermophilum]